MMEREEVQRRLTRYYLSRKENGDSPLRFIDATEEALVQALEVNDGGEAVHILRNYCQGSLRSVFAAQNPIFRNYPDAPGCLAYLVFACHAACTAGINEHGDRRSTDRDFRRRLGELLGVDATGIQLHGLNSMWRELEKWCHAHRLHYRVIQIPLTRDSRVYIGPTQDITFPTWRDKGKIRKHFDSFDIQDIEKILVELSPKDLQEFSAALRALCEEYITLLNKKDIDRHAHRLIEFFDNLVFQDRKALKIILTQTPENGWEIQLVDNDPQNAGEGLSCFLQNHQHKTNKLHKFARLGLMFFEETGYGSYQAISTPEECRQGAFAWTSIIIQKNIPQDSFSLRKEWKLAINLGTTEFKDILAELEDNPAFLEARGIQVFSLEGEFGHYSEYLCHAALLPKIHTFRKGHLTFSSSIPDIQPDTIPCSPGESIYTPSQFITASELTIRFVGSLYNAPLKRQRSLTILPYAPLSSSTRLSRVITPDWHQCNEAEETALDPHSVHSLPFQPQSSSVTNALEPIEECLCLCGNTGWGTEGLLRLLSAVLPKNAPPHWDIIRALEEGGWLYPAWAKRWGVVKRWLVPPTLLELPQGVLLWGARPKALSECFQEAVSALGGDVVLYSGISEFSPFLLLGSRVPVGALKEMLQKITGVTWLHEKKASTIPHLRICAQSPEYDSMRLTALHIVEAHWNWQECHFKNKKDATDLLRNGISLHYFTREDKRKHLLYQILDNTDQLFITPVRNAAILQACCSAKLPLFHHIKNKLTRNGIEGFLPLSLANRFAQVNLKCSGPMRQGEKWGYGYAVDELQADVLRRMFGSSLFSGIESASSISSARYHTVRHRPEQQFLYVRSI